MGRVDKVLKRDVPTECGGRCKLKINFLPCCQVSFLSVEAQLFNPVRALKVKGHEVKDKGSRSKASLRGNASLLLHLILSFESFEWKRIPIGWIYLESIVVGWKDGQDVIQLGVRMRQLKRAKGIHGAMNAYAWSVDPNHRLELMDFIENDGESLEYFNSWILWDEGLEPWKCRRRRNCILTSLTFANLCSSGGEESASAFFPFPLLASFLIGRTRWGEDWSVDGQCEESI